VQCIRTSTDIDNVVTLRQKPRVRCELGHNCGWSVSRFRCGSTRWFPANWFAFCASAISGSGLRQINLTGKSPKPVQSLAQKYSAFIQTQISGYFPAVPSRQEGRIARRHERGTGCDGRRQRQARSVFAGRLSRERTRRARWPMLRRTAKPCGSGIRGWCQAAGGESDPTGSIRHQAGSDGGKRNSSPGRARHKPSNHCAGNAGVLRLYLYARVRISLHLAHETAGAASTRHSLLPLVWGIRNFSKPRAQCVARTKMHTQLSSPAKAG